MGTAQHDRVTVSEGERERLKQQIQTVYRHLKTGIRTSLSQKTQTHFRH